ncbi:sulfite exporter TauE/SafE family protein [Xylella fastidiosa subsp. multiplex]|uniref:Probable membrane transporter protein n=1 Tax=Xylella fastidiosa subsp. multiplex TaxID=644357 RepID=A0A9Q4QT63_XYLFS|nr:sulfite exporter TauE/SafE family protein [Xylella fastidiosa subsp. multiplex]MBE0275516.1 sulfite exporter TauE/SafE family protein [Xylella fastidiosa subsp. multiplex]MBE0278101.1 sulfite exporter TauE/SafE family protein [Xylella fastidiosa subsp. multiplex]MBE0282374.1 sulfite exporter TauE/SafE family protein [Xylella fastidiosa subsp. multiplex]MRT35372.1 sulfite exporter TauE/SafE family protein [Xylella fastidiosa subsp. multiplex]
MVGLLMLRGRATAPHAEHHQTVLRMCMRTSSVAILTGAASGFFGIGGGFLIVPALIFATRMPTINAIGSSLLAVGTFGLITTLNYARHDLVDWTIAMEFIVGGITGGGLGTLLATRLSASKHLLNRVFGLIVIAVAIYVIWRSWASLVAWLDIPPGLPERTMAFGFFREYSCQRCPGSTIKHVQPVIHALNSPCISPSARFSILLCHPMFTVERLPAYGSHHLCALSSSLP